MKKRKPIPSQKDFERELADNEESMGEHAAMAMKCEFFGISEDDALAEGITCENVIIDIKCYGDSPVEITGDRYFGNYILHAPRRIGYDDFRWIWGQSCKQLSATPLRASVSLLFGMRTS